jgi:hypothetical protein
VGTRVSLDTLEKSNISCLYLELNHDSLVIQSVPGCAVLTSYLSIKQVVYFFFIFLFFCTSFCERAGSCFTFVNEEECTEM